MSFEVALPMRITWSNTSRVFSLSVRLLWPQRMTGLSIRWLGRCARCEKSASRVLNTNKARKFLLKGILERPSFFSNAGHSTISAIARQKQKEKHKPSTGCDNENTNSCPLAKQLGTTRARDHDPAKQTHPKIGCAVKHKPHRATGQNCREENAPHEATHRPYVVAVTNDVPQEATDQPYVIAPQGQDQSK